MATDLQTLQKRYINFCRRQGTLPNKSILSAIFKAELGKTRNEACIIMIFLDDLRDADFSPLLKLFMEIDHSEVDTVDILHRLSCVLKEEYVLGLLRAIKHKLGTVDLQDMSFGKDFLLDLSRRGLTCQVLNMRCSHFRKLNMTGKFMQMHTLNLDFSASLTSFREDCFAFMPNLKCLSLCETRVSNLWTTCEALTKLPSLVELRFQNCLCCDHTGPCEKAIESTASDRVESDPQIEASFLDGNIIRDLNVEEENNNYDMANESRIIVESSDDSEVDFSYQPRNFSFLEQLPDVLVDLQDEICFDLWGMQEEEEFVARFSNSWKYNALKKHISYHPSPICYEKHYRQFIIASLPNLKVLDNLPIRMTEREAAINVFSQHFEYLPYKRKTKESVASILQKREIKASDTCMSSRRLKLSNALAKSQYSYSRALSAAKVGSSPWPLLRPLSNLATMSRDDGRSFRPRQLEYHPSDSSLMAFGTLDGEVVVVNHESEKIVSYIPSLGATTSVLGLCWLKKYPSKIIAGSDNGSLALYDIQSTRPLTSEGIYRPAGSRTFDEFDQLTSVHVNSVDELFLASGYSKHVALYDITTGRRLQVFTDMHEEHINVVKFANHCPSLFATSSFDQHIKMWDLRQKPIHPCYTSASSRGNVMVCFSPDDHYLLVSAVDNEVKQLLAVDGRLHLNFDIASTGSSQNYTRSYYMNGRDYIISGSCDEHVVRVCCAQTGRRLRDVSLEGKGSGASMFVQSLRGDPFRDFNMSILAAYLGPSSIYEIVKVNLLASGYSDKEHTHNRYYQPLCMGG